MQTIYIDISNKSILPTIYAKQGDVGRKFKAVVLENSVSREITVNEHFSAGYDGASGSGNYETIGERSAFEVYGNVVTVELATNMLQAPGLSNFCLTMNGEDGNVIGLWNIIVDVEETPGFLGDPIKDYYPGISAVLYVDQNLSKEQKEKARANIGSGTGNVKTVNGIAPDENGNVAVAGGLNETARALLITVLRNAVYTSDQFANITALENALASNMGGGESPDTPELTLVSIAATYSGGDVAIGTALNKLTGVVVKAVYSDGSTATVTDYTLTGEIAEGSNTITVSYSGKTTTFTVTGVAESGGETDIHDGYIPDGLEFRLDGIRNTESGHVANTNWSDVSGNNHAITINSANTTFNNDHIYTENRNTVKVTDHVALLSKLSNYTFEVVWKSPEVVQDRNNNPLVAVGDGAVNYPLLNCGKMITVGSNTTYGTYVSGETQINHYTITYDGTAQKLYHEGVLDAEIAANIDITAATKVNFFGNDAWSNHTKGYYYAVRVYTRALSAEEVKANYDNDIARFGTVGAEVA